MFLDSLANFELKIVSAPILKIGTIPVGIGFQRNIGHSYYLWSWQFLVYYSYVPDCPKFHAISDTSYKLLRASCTGATHDYIQELNELVQHAPKFNGAIRFPLMHAIQSAP